MTGTRITRRILLIFRRFARSVGFIVYFVFVVISA